MDFKRNAMQSKAQSPLLVPGLLLMIAMKLDGLSLEALMRASNQTKIQIEVCAHNITNK